MRRWLSAVRALVALLAALVAAGAALPVLARLHAGEHAHVCHCDTRGGHAACACPVCFPELQDDDALGHASVSGKCGDDDAGWRTLATPGVLAAAYVVAPAAGRVAGLAEPDLVTGEGRAPPEVPPPEAGRSPST